MSGHVTLPNTNKVIALCVIYQEAQKNVEVKARDSLKIEYLTSIKYSEPVLVGQFSQERDKIRERAIDVNIIYVCVILLKSMKIHGLHFISAYEKSPC